MIFAVMLPDGFVGNVAGEHIICHDLPQGIILDAVFRCEFLHLRLLVLTGEFLEGGVQIRVLGQLIEPGADEVHHDVLLCPQGLVIRPLHFAEDQIQIRFLFLMGFIRFLGVLQEVQDINDVDPVRAHQLDIEVHVDGDRDLRVAAALLILVIQIPGRTSRRF